MPETLLLTKLFVPPLRPNLVPRPHLIERLNQGLHLGHKLTLISAPAGFGKTTLAGEWLAGCGRQAAWLSLDEGDNNPTRFLAYLVAALQTVSATIGEGVLAALQSLQPAPTESILTPLLNEISTIPDNFILVLDDYQVIEATQVDKALTFLLEHLPPQMHLVIATRDDPQLPLARLRARGHLTELRAADLRFTSTEAAEFLNQVMGLELSVDDIAALETRTEGWIAGLQLAALSIHGHKDATSLIKAFTGSHRFVLDYLVEEVLLQQSESVQTFLLQTAVLNRLTGPLCDAITGQENGQAILEKLDRDNVFIVPLDSERRWYRYHHLFADLLRQRLRQTHLEQIPTLHSRASAWYEMKDQRSDAIHHAFAAQDFERAADLVELAWPAWSRPVQSIAWLSWAKELPDDLVRARPVLSVAYAQALLNAGKLEAAEARLMDAERWLGPMSEQLENPVTQMVVVDEEQFRSLPASLATTRAYHAQSVGDVHGTVKYTRRVLDLLPEKDHAMRASLTMLLGLTYWASGDLEAAHRAFSEGLAGIQRAGNVLDIIGATFVLADIRVTLGHLHEAASAYEYALQLATEHGEPMPLGTEDAYSGISGLHLERGDLEVAAQDLATSKKLGEQVELPDWQYRWCIAQARLKETLGDLDGALDLLNEAERLYVRTPLPTVRPIAAMKARVWVKQGRLTKALRWARERGLSAADDLSYLQEFEHITLARALIAQYKSKPVDGSIDEVAGLLKRLLQAAEEGSRTGSVIEILVLQAAADEAQGNIHPALVSLERALTLAEPEDYVRMFVDEGPSMARLLYIALSRGIGSDYVRRLLAAFPVKEHKQTEPVKSQAPAPDLIEPLSKREIEVLQLIAEGLSNPEIAARLYLSLNTVKVHSRNIYGKLGVHNRMQAAARARALGILPSI